MELYKTKPGDPQSVHIDLFPAAGELREGFTDEQRKQAADWEALLPLREQVYKGLDGAREDKVIGSALEAAVTVWAEGDLLALLKRHQADLPTWFIVSQVKLEEGASRNRD